MLKIVLLRVFIIIVLRLENLVSVFYINGFHFRTRLPNVSLPVTTIPFERRNVTYVTLFEHSVVRSTVPREEGTWILSNRFPVDPTVRSLSGVIKV